MKKITFCITTAKNERPYIELLFKSILNGGINVNYHDFLVFVDSDNQNTTQWLIEQKKYFKNLKIIKNNLPVPVCCPINVQYLFKISETPIVTYLQSDMVVSNKFDESILNNLKENIIISSTRIEPPLHSPSDNNINYVRNLGFNPEEFKYDEFINMANFIKTNRLTNWFFAPYTLYKNLWVDIGGEDSVYRRSRDDSDMLYRMCLNGVICKQDWASIVYHFSCVSSRGSPDWYKTDIGKNRAQLQQLADNIELKRLIRKFGQFKHPSCFDEIKDDYKYNISINFLNCKDKPVEFFYEHYWLFNKIYIDDNVVRNKVIDYFNYEEHKPANTLLNYTTDDWNKYKKYFNYWDGKDIFINNKVNDDIILTLDTNKYTKNISNIFSQIPLILHENLKEGDDGDFECENIYIKVNKLQNKIKDNIYCKNPPLDNIPFEIL